MMGKPRHRHDGNEFMIRHVRDFAGDNQRMVFAWTQSGMRPRNCNNRVIVTQQTTSCVQSSLCTP